MEVVAATARCDLDWERGDRFDGGAIARARRCLPQRLQSVNARLGIRTAQNVAKQVETARRAQRLCLFGTGWGFSALTAIRSHRELLLGRHELRVRSGQVWRHLHWRQRTQLSIERRPDLLARTRELILGA